MKKSFAIVAALVTALSAWAVTTEDYAKHFTITVPTDLGEQVFENFPVLVRLSTDIVGFDYADFKVEGGGDMIFTDDGGTILSHEIDTWDTTGTSLVWVKTPSLTGGTVLHCYYAGPDASSVVTATDTWSDYAGVWHLGECGEAGTSYDSTAHGLNGANGASTTQYQAGAIGAARQIYYDYWGTGSTYGQGIVIPSYDDLEVGGTFTVSGWFYHASGGMYYDNLFNRPGGFTVKTSEANFKKIGLLGKGAECKSADIDFPSLVKETWAKCDFIYNASAHKGYVYVNGVFLSEVNMWNANNDAVDSGTQLCIGAPLSSTVEEPSKSAWNGRVDEVRLRKGMLSAEWIAAEYAMETTSDLTQYGPVVDNASDVVLLITANITELGSPVPAYGSYVTSEAPTSLASGSEAFKDGICYVADKYQVRISEDGGMSWSEPEVREGSSFNYVIDDKLTEVTWLWRPIAYALEADSISGRGTVSVTWDKDADYTDDDGVRYYLEGSEIVLSAVDSAGGTSICRRWLDGTDDRSSVGSSVTVLSDRPRRMTAVFASEWTYDADAKTLTDGRWVLKTTYADKKGFTVTGATTVADDGVLDLSAAVNSDLAYSKIYSIGASAFKSNSALAAVYFNEALKLIDASAFEGCSGISGEVDLPRTVQLQSKAFKDCVGITRVVLHEDGTQKLGASAFYGCTGLKTVEPLLPAGIASGSFSELFRDCRSLTGDLVMESSATTIFYARVFNGTKITSAKLPNVRMINGYNFDGCESLTNVEFSTLNSIGDYDFRGCSELLRVRLNEGITNIGQQAFNKCTKLNAVDPFLPDSLVSLGVSAFDGCTALSGDLCLKGVGVVSEKAFVGTTLGSAVLPVATSVRKYAFGVDQGSSMTNIVLGPRTVDLDYYCPMSMQSSGGSVFFAGNAPLPQFGTTTFGATDYKIRIYCDPVMDPDGWTALMQSAYFQPLTEDDKARSTYPGDKTLGILLSSNNKKYWLIKYKSPLRKPGLMLLVR